MSFSDYYKKHKEEEQTKSSGFSDYYKKRRGIAQEVETSGIDSLFDNTGSMPVNQEAYDKASKLLQAKKDSEAKKDSHIVSDYVPNSAFGMTKSEYDKRRKANPDMPEFGSYGYFVEREKALKPMVDEIANDAEHNDETYRAWADNYARDNTWMQGKPVHEKAKSLYEKFQRQNAILAEYSAIHKQLEEFGVQGIHYDDSLEIDAKSGAEEAKYAADRLSAILGATPLTNEEAFLGLYETAPQDKQANYDKYKSIAGQAAIEASKEKAYEYYDKNKDKVYDDNLVGRVLGNSKLGRIGIESNKAGFTSFAASSEDIEASEVYQLLSDRIQRVNEETFRNNTGFDNTVATISQYIPQGIDQFVLGTAGRLAGGQFGSAIASSTYMYEQTAGASFVRLLQETDLDVEDAKKLATSEALASGAVEFGLDFVTSGLWKGGSALTKGVTSKAGNAFLKKLTDIGISERGARIILDTAKNAGRLAMESTGEGAEEWLQEGISITADKYADAENAPSALELFLKSLDISQYSSEEIARMKEAGIGGATIGFAMGGGNAAVSSVQSHFDPNRQIGATIRKNDTVDKILDMASVPFSPEEATAYEAYKEYAESGISASNARDIEIGDLAVKLERDLASVINSDNTSGDQKTAALSLLRDLEAYKQNKSISRLGKGKVKKVYGDAEHIEALIAEGLESGEGTKAYELATKYKAKVDSGKKLSAAEITRLVDATDAAVKSETEKAVAERLTELGETGDVEKLSDIIARKETGELLTSAEQKMLEESKYGSRVAEEVTASEEELSEASVGLSEDEATLFRENYSGGDVESYRASFDLVSELARNNYGADYILENKGVLSPRQVQNIYSKIVTEPRMASQRALDGLVSKYEGKLTYKSRVDDSVFDGVKGEKLWKSLNKRQKQAITFAKAFAKGAGINLTITYGEKYNGYYDPATNSIVIDARAGFDRRYKAEDAIIPTMSHELTHWAKQKAPELYAELSRKIFGIFKDKGLSEAALIEAEQKKHPEYTDDQARDEIIARACEDLFSMSESGREIFNSLSENEQKTLNEKIKEIIKNLVDWVNELLGLYESKSDEAGILRGYKEGLSEAAKLWDEMFASAVKVNAALEAEGVFGNLENGISEDGTTIVGNGVLQMSEKDSEGRTLSIGQAEYFKDSKVRDANGNLLVMYHGTKEDFTVFDKSKLKDALGFFFTEDKREASEYGTPKATYLNIKKPFDMFGDTPIENFIGNSPKNIDGHFNWDAAVKGLVDAGYDGVYSFSHGIRWYIAFNPEQIKSIENKNPTSNADIRYSEKDTGVSAYDIMGKQKELEKRYKILEKDFARLKEMYKLDKRLTHGKVLDPKQVEAVARYLVKYADSDYKASELAPMLNDLYVDIREIVMTNPDATWEELYSKAYEVAKEIRTRAKVKVERPAYYEKILKEIRSARIAPNEGQKGDARYRFGDHYIGKFRGRVIIANDGTPLDIKWSEWANKYPDVFDASISDAQQLVELYDIYDDLRNAEEVVVDYTESEMLSSLTEEIINKAWGIDNYESTADKYDKRMKELRAEHRKAMEELRETYEAKAAATNKELELYTKLYGDMWRKRREAYAKAKELGRKKLARYKENAERKRVIESITNYAKTLLDWYETNSKDKHIHDSLKGPVKELLLAIDFSSKQLLGMKGTARDKRFTPTKNDISIAEALDHLKKSIDNFEGTDDIIDEMRESELPKRISDLLDTYKENQAAIQSETFVLNMMTSEELKRLRDIIKNVKSVVINANKFHIAHRNANAIQKGEESIAQLDARAKVFEDNKKHFGQDLDMLKSKIYWNNLNPYYAFRNMGEAAQGIFEAFMDGDDKFIALSDDVEVFAQKTWSSKEAKSWRDTYFDFAITKPDGKVARISMNVPQIMSLYCVTKQEDAKKHILHGKEDYSGKGITLTKTKKTNAVVDNIPLTEAQLNEIIGVLDDKSKVGRAKEVADAIQEYMSRVGSQLGNEITMARWGIKSFGIENYFPIRVSRDTVNNGGETPPTPRTKLIALLNASFTHARNNYAQNSAEIGDIFDVFSTHMSDMILYNSYALPLLDMYKWMNFKSVDGVANENSVQRAVVKTFGEAGWDYLQKFLEDVGGTTKTDSRDNIGMKLFRKAKVAKVAAKLKVVALQFTSFIRAGAVMDNKYLLHALHHVPKIKKAQENCGIARRKAKGYYDTDIARSLSENIKHEKSVYDKVIDVSLWGASAADNVTMGVLWNACELEIRDTRKDLKVGSPEFNEAVGKRLREVIYRTQVVDSLLTRSSNMRSKAGLVKMYTSFASESTLSLNLALDTIVTTQLDAREMGGLKNSLEKNGKYVRKAAIAYVTTAAVTAVMEAAFAFLYDYDDDEREDNFGWDVLKNFILNLSITNKIPFVKEIWNFFQGYSSSNLSAGGIEEIVKFAKEVFKLLQGDANMDRIIKLGLQAGSDVSGIPAYNLIRDFKMIYYNLFGYDK